ncbi:Rho3 GTP binding protein [Mrakia frigida]|uniref:Rho3 GTP binding protein n=1 Tax=Mrakia frigida TaxID=29902 RepID=UPI003FCC1613
MNCFTSSSSNPNQRGSKPLQRKLVVLGDGACGKTSLLNVFCRGYFPSEYEPTVFENYVSDVRVNGQLIELSLWDTAGQEEFDRLRSLSYADTHIIMVCYSIDSPVSLENVESKWLPEVMEHCPGVKIVLVALKCDLRNEPRKPNAPPHVTYEEGLEVAKRIRASRYLECSAKHNRGVGEAFDATAHVAVGARPRGGGAGSGREEWTRRARGGRDGERGCAVM